MAGWKSFIVQFLAFSILYVIGMKTLYTVGAWIGIEYNFAVWLLYASILIVFWIVVVAPMIFKRNV